MLVHMPQDGYQPAIILPPPQIGSPAAKKTIFALAKLRVLLSFGKRIRPTLRFGLVHTQPTREVWA